MNRLTAVQLANIRKAKDDTRRLRKGMRFVITLEGGHIDNLFKSAEYRIHCNKDYTGNGIAILGPAFVHGIFLPDALLCEISLSRGASYATAEREQREQINPRPGRRANQSRYLIRRHRVRKLESEELHMVWPALEDFLHYVMTEARKEWKTQGPWYWQKGRKSDRGVYAVVSNKDGLLYHKVLIEDVRYRQHKYLDSYVAAIQFWLRGYNAKTYDKRAYTAKQMQSYKGLQKVTDLWASANMSRLAREYIYMALSGRERELLDRVIELYHLKGLSCSHRSAISSNASRLPMTELVWFYIRPKKRTSHAKGCVVFEVLPRNGKSCNTAKG